jgi:hypothetical protein
MKDSIASIARATNI